MLTRALAEEFAPSVRRRGEECASRDLVRIEVGSEHSVLALVTGRRSHVVELWRKGDALRALCGCLGFVDGGACPHLWAALLMAERRGLLRAGDPPDRLILEEHPDADAIRSLGLADDDVNDDGDGAEAPGDEADFEAPAEEALSEPEPEPAPAPAPEPEPPRTIAAAAGAMPAARPVQASIADLLDEPSAPRPAASRRVREWRRLSRELIAARRAQSEPAPDLLPRGARIAYVVDLERSREEGALVVQVAALRGVGAAGAAKPQRLSLRRDVLGELPDADDRAILQALAGARPAGRATRLEEHVEHVASSFRLERDVHAAWLERMAATGRLHVRESESAPLEEPARWDASGFRVRLRLEPAGAAEDGGWLLRADVTNGLERLPAEALRLAAPGFLVLPGPRVTACPDELGHRLLVDERVGGPVRIPPHDLQRAIALLTATPGAPPLDAPGSVALERREVTPRPRFVVRTFGSRAGLLAGELTFEYDGRRIDEDDSDAVIVDDARRLAFPRDAGAEEAARRTLRELRVRPPREDARGARPWLLSPRRLSEIVARLVGDGWIVEAEGRRQRAAGRVTLSASSDSDWFELRGEVDFEGISCPLPEILRALERNERTVRLSDGSVGLLPADWLAKHAPWMSLGRLKRDHVRFAPSQAALLDALLAADPGASCDAAFAALRRRIHDFEGLPAEPQPPGFAGTLRDYQRQGLAWMRFLRETGFGGCLADDMGVGKTAQVLAMLASRKAEQPAGRARPSIIVVPRSLVFNWQQEAAKFTPGLRVHDHSGASRSIAEARLADVVLCTYGTLRRDIAVLREIDFDCAILDEAQAIKNASTSASKAARLLRARHRLALSGTPIENHLGELWSLFEFLNPGMLGKASAFAKASAPAADLRPSDHALLARAIRPFLLRRTKQQVARELPSRTDLTMRCVLLPAHRRQYDELRQHYRRELLGLVDSKGMSASRMHVLEALLRLRQLACHPGLVDPDRRKEPSAKLDLLLERLVEIAEEGHKALVFSQFTTFLRIVRDRLRARGLSHEYLDGATTDRQERVQRFQSDDGCRAFLISLKAGGTGLNLTSADYVFLLDPWWNPAVEAQAIDRSHRLGQKRQVFAYRLIAADTVEDRVVDMQAEKRALAEALLGTGGRSPGDLGREDLELLLS